VVFWITDLLGTQSIQEKIPLQVYIIHLLDIPDSEEADPLVILSRLKMALGHLEKKEKVVFMCTAGISRSNALAIASLVILENLSWEEAKEKVRRKVPRMQINLGFEDRVKEALFLYKLGK